MFTVESTQSTEHGWVTTMKLGDHFVPLEGRLDDFIVALGQAGRMVPGEYQARLRYEIEAVDEGNESYCSYRAALNITYERPATAEEIGAAENEQRDWQARQDAHDYMRYQQLRAKFAGYGRNGR